jgi:hypothetical protein
MNGFIAIVLLCTFADSPHGCHEESLARQTWEMGPLECELSVNDCYWECMSIGQSFAEWLKTVPEKLEIPSGRFGVKCKWSQEA